MFGDEQYFKRIYGDGVFLERLETAVSVGGRININLQKSNCQACYISQFTCQLQNTGLTVKITDNDTSQLLYQFLDNINTPFSFTFYYFTKGPSIRIFADTVNINFSVMYQRLTLADQNPRS